MVRRALLLALIALAAAPASASAHALLESTAPTGGERLETAPRQVVLDFNEPIEAAFGAVRVFGADGTAVPTGEPFRPGGADDRVGVRLPAGLERGSYTVTYRVVSADSHPVSGGFVFAYGEATVPTAGVDELLQGASAGSVTTTALSAARAVQFAAIALGAGALIFLVVCWLPALAEATGAGAAWQAASAAFAARLRALLVAAGIAGAASAALAIVLQGANAAGTGFGAALDGTVLREVLGTRFGTVWGIGAVAWVAVTGLAAVQVPRLPVLRTASVGATGLAPPARPGTAALVALGLPLGLVCVLPALGGHASVQAPQALLLPANILHVLAMAAWLGGIAVLVLALRSATRAIEGPDRMRLLGAVVARFSAMAGVAIAVILATGIAQSIVSVESFDRLLDTAFGRAVLIKLVLFVAICALGFVNRRRFLPRLRGESGAAAGALLRRTLRVELLVGVAVIAVTGALAGYPPSSAVSAGPFSGTAAIGPARVDLTVDPARVGANEVHLYLFDRRTGAQYDAPDEVRVTARQPARGIAPIDMRVNRAGPGHYTVAAGTFGVAGDWELRVEARVGEFDLYTATIEVPIE